MASGRPPGDGPDPARRQRGKLPNEEGLRALGSQIDGGVPPSTGPVANEGGLNALGQQIDRSGGRRGRKRRRPRRSLRRRIVTGVAVVVAFLVLVAAGGYGYLQYRYSQLKKIHVAADRPEIPGQPFNVLVLGSDSRVGESSQAFGAASLVTGQRSDVIMIWHVNPATNQVSLMSIPRDTLVQMIGSDVNNFGQFNRINAAYNSGANQLVKTIEANFGIPINHVVQVDFAGFQGAVNALGGVWMNFPYPAKDVWSGLNITTPGCQLLSGAQALAVARSRHYQYYADGYWQYDGTSDFGRITRQDAFLRSLIDAAKSKNNPFTLNAFLGSLPQGLVIDDGFSLPELVDLALHFHGFSAESLQGQTFPTTSVGYVSPWGDILFADQPAAQQMLVSMFGNELMTPTNPPPNTDLQPAPPPVVTPTSAPAATGSAGGAGTGSTAASPPPPPDTTTTTAPPSFDPTSCTPH
ncbi:MAG TPA: LCP family protein [Acidimicrobiales bacterium]|nr:LCP family protein [Acidimicrobiales bacterium]